MKSILTNITFFVLSALLISPNIFASQCDDKFPNKKEIKVPNTTVLCNTFYATVFDEAHNAAIFSTEVYQAKTGPAPTQIGRAHV